MKQWITRQWIALAEVFGWSTPRWIRNLLTEQEYSALTSQEKGLTEALTREAPLRHPAPETLAADIRRKLSVTQIDPAGSNTPGLVLMPLTAMAATVLLGFFIWSARQDDLTADRTPPQLAGVSEAEPDVVPDLVVAHLPDLSGTATMENMLLQPLTKEQAYLAADLTNAVLFVAENVVPNQYMQRVRSRFSTLEVTIE